MFFVSNKQAEIFVISEIENLNATFLNFETNSWFFNVKTSKQQTNEKLLEIMKNTNRQMIDLW